MASEAVVSIPLMKSLRQACSSRTHVFALYPGWGVSRLWIGERFCRPLASFPLTTTLVLEAARTDC